MTCHSLMDKNGTCWQLLLYSIRGMLRCYRKIMNTGVVSASSHHPVADYFPVTAHHGVIWELLTIIIRCFSITKNLLNELLTDNNYSSFVYEYLITRYGRAPGFTTARRWDRSGRISKAVVFYSWTSVGWDHEKPVKQRFTIGSSCFTGEGRMQISLCASPLLARSPISVHLARKSSLH